MKNKRKKLIFTILIMALLAFTPQKIEQYEFPVYRVVVDPGHGGIFHQNRKKHGDKFDSVTGTYINYFAEGANLKGIFERDIVFSIATRTLKYLDMCAPEGDFSAFSKILERYTDNKLPRIYIVTMLSREDSIPFDQAGKVEDPNGPYRLYDYPDSDGNMQLGRISKINSFKPHIVVSLHLAKSAPPEYKGLNGIIVPPYSVLKSGLLNLQKGGKGRINDYGILRSWFREAQNISPRLSYFKDCVNYFTGYGLKKDYTTDYRDFNGYKHNMVTWIYNDPPEWHIDARNHKPGTAYSSDYLTFREEGKFWEREKSVYEVYRRGESFRNFGGDNYFATYELIRYILQSLDHRGVGSTDKVPGKPFVSTWSMPLLINAVSAYIELGYLDRKWDRNVLLNRQEEIAEGLAVGVYSLFAGAGEIKGGFRHKPSGEKLDLNKYRLSEGVTYFDIVAE